MAIKMVREPSETPNINNIDDIIPMRYAYGGQNGFVIGKGTEISNTINGNNFIINSGRLVLQGVECDIDATGVTITIDNIATKRYYTVYLEVNLGLNIAIIKSEYDTATYPTIDVGDDLTENTTGVARLPLYQFTATSGIIGEVNKVVESVKYVPTFYYDNNILKIGDIIIPQRKLIWENDNEDIQTGEFIIQTNEEIYEGDILEIDLKTTFFDRYIEDMNENFEKIRIKYNKEYFINGVLNMGVFSNQASVLVWDIPITVIDSTKIKFGAGVKTYILAENNTSNLVTWNMDGDVPKIIYKVYKIIE